jgi:hypothetical protein
MQEPGEADVHRTTDPAQREALASQVFHHGALLIRHATVVGRGHTLPLARFAPMGLLAMAGRAIVLVPAGSTRWARVSHDQDCW